MSFPFYWHGHHDILLEPCDYEDRVAFIKAHKPLEEQEVHLARLKPVRGQLPPEIVVAGAAYERVLAALDQARVASTQARVAYGKARAVYTRAKIFRDLAAYEGAWAAEKQARAAYDRVLAACDQAGAVYEGARAAYEGIIKKHQEELDTLHAQECPNCPWDGKTLFPKGVSNV